MSCRFSPGLGGSTTSFPSRAICPPPRPPPKTAMSWSMYRESVQESQELQDRREPLLACEEAWDLPERPEAADSTPALRADFCEKFEGATEIAGLRPDFRLKLDSGGDPPASSFVARGAPA